MKTNLETFEVLSFDKNSLYTIIPGFIQYKPYGDYTSITYVDKNLKTFLLSMKFFCNGNVLSEVKKIVSDNLF